MTEPQPSDRDLETARDAALRWGIYSAPTVHFVEPGITFEKALASLLAAARAEGRQDERSIVEAEMLVECDARCLAVRREAIEECARIADAAASLRSGGPYQSGHFQACRDIAIAIRALADPTPSSPIRFATDAELRAQRRSYVAGEAALGSDADEAAYRSALDRGDKAEIARLDAEAEKRRQRAIKWMDENDG